MRRFLRQNGLSLVLLAIFALSISGQAFTGFREHAQDETDHGRPGGTFSGYLRSGHFVEAVFENWESEFLQMALFVVLTTVLRQKGSSESKRMEGEEPQDRDPRKDRRPDSPGPVHRGGLLLAIYSNSLGLALGFLFVVSFALHAYGGARAYDDDREAHGQPPLHGMVEYVGTSRFWFESFQNWQSEFVSVAALVLLSTRLRQRGSPQSKPVAAPHGLTESEAEDSGPPPPGRERPGAQPPA